MANETYLTLVGRLTADPELKRLPSGQSVCNFTVATSPRLYKDGQWTDGETSFHDCEAWASTAEHLVQTCRKASRVIVFGTLQQQHFTNREGENRSRWVLRADEIGPSLRFVSAQLSEPDSARGAGGNGRQPSPAGLDPWAS